MDVSAPLDKLRIFTKLVNSRLEFIMLLPGTFAIAIVQQIWGGTNFYIFYFTRRMSVLAYFTGTGIVSGDEWG